MIATTLLGLFGFGHNPDDKCVNQTHAYAGISLGCRRLQSRAQRGYSAGKLGENALAGSLNGAGFVLRYDWRRLDEPIEGLSNGIIAITRQDASCCRQHRISGHCGRVQVMCPARLRGAMTAGPLEAHPVPFCGHPRVAISAGSSDIRGLL